MHKKRILVTGAGGFIGSHLVERLVAEGASVRAFVRYNSRGDPGLLRLLPPNIQARLEIVAGDLRDAQAVRQAVEGRQVVFHLGALVSIPYSYRHPADVAETNFIGTLNVLLACRDLGVERLVHTSTSEVYGTALREPIDETHPLQGQSPYSASKIGADKLVESFFCSYNLPVVTIRPFNTYGPRQSARAVIPAIITQALTQSTIRLGNLDTMRDFTYIQDTVEGFMRGAAVPAGFRRLQTSAPLMAEGRPKAEGRRSAEGAPSVLGMTFNLGVGQNIRVGDLARKIIQLVNKPVKIVVDTARLRPERSEVLNLISDNSLALEYLHWQPKVSLDQGLEQTIDWIQQHLDLYRVGTYEF